MNTLSPTVQPSESAGADADADSPAEAAEPPEPEPTEHPPEPAVQAAAGPVSVSLLAGVETVEPSWLAERLARAVQELRQPVRRLTVIVVDDARMADLHRRYLGAEHTTDVLTFLASEAGQPVEADIAICLDVAARESADRGHPVAHELLLYALHGVLHGCGFDDHDDDDFAAMHAEEDRVLRAIGIGATFDRADADSETAP
jgi:probable rRNA maturation factor